MRAFSLKDLTGGLYKGGEKMQKEKLEQLKVIFKLKIKDVIKKAKLRQEYFETDDQIQKIVDGFVYEVKIRIDNK
ncbi:hypothetical protein ES705_37309 [subsurface metagenome]